MRRRSSRESGDPGFFGPRTKTLTTGRPHVLFLFMPEPVEKADLILDEITRLSLEMARDLQQRALKAERDEDAASLAQALNHTCRSIRQSLALQARLQRDRKRSVSEARQTRRTERKAQVRAAVQRLVWTEKPDWNLVFTTRPRLDLILDAEAEDETFLEGPVQDHIARIAQALGLPPLIPSDAGTQAEVGPGNGFPERPVKSEARLGSQPSLGRAGERAAALNTS